MDETEIRPKEIEEVSKNPQDAYRRLESFKESMRTEDPNNAWNFIDRELTESDVAAITEDLNAVVKDLADPDKVEDTLFILKYYARFENTNRKSEVNHQVQESALRVIAEGVSNNPSLISEENLSQTAQILELLSLSVNSDEIDVRNLGEETILANVAVITKGLQDVKQRSYYFRPIQAVLSLSPTERTQRFKDAIVETLVEDETSIYFPGFLGAMLGSSNPDLRNAGADITERYIEQRFPGINSKIFVGEWLRAAGDRESDRSHNITGNILRLEELEEAHAGSVKSLHERFGIVNFGRYPTELLVRQYEQKDDQGQYGVVLYPREDWNGVFHENMLSINSFMQDIQSDFRLRVYEIGSKRELAESLIRAERDYGKIGFAVIGGHGTEDSIQFGKGRMGSLYAVDIFNYISAANSVDDLGWAKEPRPVAQRVINRFFVENPEIILVSCSTGGGEDGGIASKISRLGARVTGPDKPAPLLQLNAEKLPNGKYRLNAIYQRSEPQTYVNGVKVIED